METGLWNLIGEKSLFSKLKNIQITKIRNEYSEGLISQRQLAKKYNITQATIWAILNNRTWKHIKNAGIE